MESVPTSLADLAARFGVLTSVRDATGRSQNVAPEVIVGVLRALGVDLDPDAGVDLDEGTDPETTATSDEEGSENSDEIGAPAQADPYLLALARDDEERWARVLPPHVVLREGWTPWVPVRLHAGTEFTAVIVREDGEEVALGRGDKRPVRKSIGGVEYEESTLEVPRSLPLGYHVLTVNAGDTEHSCPLVVTPARMVMPAALSGVKAWGVAGQLYAMRSDRSWGIGDAADLAELGTWAARSGADYVNVGPINADDPVPTIDPNPYRPVSRRALDPLAIRVEEVRELGYLSAAEHQLVEWHGDDARRLNLTDDVDRDAVWQSKRAALRMVFNVDRSHRRRRDFEEFVAGRGQELLDFATWCVLARVHGLPFSAWDPELRDPRSDAVAAFRDEHAQDIEFECWLQWVARAQFLDAAAEVKAAGMRIGVMHDIAPGTIDGGFEQWARPGDHAEGLRVGVRASDGTVTDLGLAALTPAALARDGFALWKAVLRDMFALSGAVRVERIGTLFRQWWQRSDGTGAFVRFDHEALIGILLLEAQRAGCVVVAGDENETEEWVRSYLRERGLISSQVLWQEGRGARLRGDDAGAHRVMAALAGKDDAPAAAFLTAAQAKEAQRHQLVDDVESYADRVAAHREALLAAMEERGLAASRASLEEQVGALHRHLASGPAIMFTVRVGDLVGDVRRPGLHGVDHVHALWRLPVAGPDEAPLTLDDVMTSRRAKRVIRVVRRG